ncbi:hypothetical protein M758_1G238100 [Ceratodon purpureus]|nr:hypothetical protein M758_1G238100 [Ceratodon purpureus]
MGEESPQYTLRCQLFGHEEDVRGLGVSHDGVIATGSRDKSVRIWNSKEGEREYNLDKTLVGHTNFVGTVAWIPPNEALPAGGLVSGGMDTRVLVWDLENASIAKDLKGHKLQVSNVAVVDSNGDILSASVDSTVRRWRNGKVVEVLEGHEGPVQAVISLPNGDVVTGSSDTTMRLWRGSACISTIRGHTDTVRGLTLMPNVGIVSASHDGSVRLWALSGEQLLEFVGHTAIVYSVASHSSGDIASGSEDGFAKIWRGGVCVQSIEHPGCVWDVAFLPNGDLVTACSDGVARVWTREKKLYAPAEEMEAFVSLVSSRKTAAKTVGGVKVEDLPGVEALEEPGTKNGQTRIVREGTSGVAYSWNLNEYKWEKVGEVVDGPGNSAEAKTLHGVTYDYVFDVDIGDGLPTRKLPYNVGDNPYDIADKWLEDEGLSPGYRQQVVEFILQNTGNAAATTGFDPNYVDPYTGANAYVPGQQARQPQTSRSAAPTPVTSTPSTPVYKHVPMKGMLFFDTAQFEGITKKLTEFSAAWAAEEAHKELALSQADTLRIQAMIATLKETSRYHASSFADVDFKLLTKMALQWPVENIFPVLDLMRMMLLHPQCAAHFANEATTGNDVLLEALRRATGEPVLIPNLLTSARVAVNAFKNSALRNWSAKNRSEILDLFSGCCASMNKNVRLAFVTLVLNYSVLSLENKDEEGQIQVLSAAVEVVIASWQNNSRCLSCVCLFSIPSLYDL